MKVGDYVRTKDGRISIIEDIDRNGLYILKDYNYSYKNDWLIKSSPNIIDLIEVGDYVNEHFVIDKNPNAIYIEDSQNKLAHIPYTKKEIKSIVTKEQFDAMKYEVK